MTVSSEVRSPGLARTVFLSTSAFMLVVAIVASPKEAFDASIQGLDIWWKIVFPALLPFLMLSQMLTAFGFTHALGVLLEPLMRRLFRLPGHTGFVLAVGMCGGFPTAVDAVSRLLKDQQMTARQAVIITAAAHFANPMMILLVVGGAFLHNPAAGYFLLIIHWISGWIAAAVAIRFIPASRKKNLVPDSISSNKAVHSLSPAQNQAETNKKQLHPLAQNSQKLRIGSRMLLAAREAHSRDARGFGKLLGDTVSQAVQVLMLTGGYIIVFAVFIRLLSLYLTPGISVAVWPSVLELHLGTYHISKTANAPALLMAFLAGALGWGGVCSHLQVSSMLRTAIPGLHSMLFFIIVRLGHGLTAFILTLWLWEPFSRYSTEVSTTWQTTAVKHSDSLFYWPFLQFPDTISTLQFIWNSLPVAALSLALLLGVMISLSGLTLWINRLFSR
ncbi:nucleoside recognition protein [Paenibacillus polysaccharolyticus]|uniref:nucleoside recognition domain-containing protein n=1 Tax=Paenibacillus polysaccharolyticus TaxID=582692 RepID=UPI0020419D33|nr:nucleoside recognition domain-containing protein [Paenibacillus polysaccharolyticus]MCM3131933.1 nucleoside recognition protein [Paenibacillus polysaccharolyticus]